MNFREQRNKVKYFMADIATHFICSIGYTSISLFYEYKIRTETGLCFVIISHSFGEVQNVRMKNLFNMI